MPGPRQAELDSARHRALGFLSKQQEADGSFLSFSSASALHFRKLRSWQTVFVPALMLASLSRLEEPAAVAIRTKLTKFLLDQKSDNWSFNYWSKKAPEHESQSYPDDLDDTFCSLAGLYLHDPSIIDAAALARVVKLLLATETAVGGPYRTWLVSGDSPAIWLDVDTAVNSNIAYFLALTGSRLPRLDGLMGQAIGSGNFSSPYYPSEYAFVYYFARSYEGPHKPKLLRKARHMHKAAETDLDRALCLSARVRLGDIRPLGPEAKLLVASQRNDGSWPAAAFYADPVKDGKAYYDGAPALTTTFVLEALRLYERNDRPAKIGYTKAGAEKPLTRAALRLARQQCAHLGKDLQQIILSALERIANGSNGSEIISLGDSFVMSLRHKPKGLPPDFAVRLGAANLYGWLAYTIYDDFLDGAGRPDLISAANAAMRRSLDGFKMAVPPDKDFDLFVDQTFDTIDSANAWEQASCRFEVEAGQLRMARLPDYGDLAMLADRSLGHVLAPVAVLSAAGYQPGSAEAKRLVRAFRHYLIARQLNDDAHDWEEDLQNGHITVVVKLLLDDLKNRTGSHDLGELAPRARRQFWHGTLPRICELMRTHVKLSRQALQRCATLRQENVIGQLLDGIEISITETLEQRAQAEDFLKNYGNAAKANTRKTP